jgi:general L-amino acid transport system substrate-binding protein
MTFPGSGIRDPGSGIRDPGSANLGRRMPGYIIRTMVRTRVVTSTATVLLCLMASVASGGPRLDRIRQRGYLTCGVEPAVAGFAEVDAQGQYRGFDVDVCRAIAAAIFGAGEKTRFIQVSNVADFLNNDQIDVVSRRLTWELRREGPLPILFGPITFYDGQGFLAARSVKARSLQQLSGTPVCVAGGTNFEFTVGSHFREHKLALKKVVLESAADFEAIATALSSGRCRAYTADVSELGAIRARLPRPMDFEILSEQISREPLAPLVRQDDPQLFVIVRWTIFALINAEELGVTARNLAAMRASDNVDVQRLLGVVPGNGKALGLSESWANDAIRAVGNYGEMFEKNIGRGSSIKLDRGLNRLAANGGLMYAPPLR